MKRRINLKTSKNPNMTPGSNVRADPSRRAENVRREQKIFLPDIRIRGTFGSLPPENKQNVQEIKSNYLNGISRLSPGLNLHGRLNTYIRTKQQDKFNWLSPGSCAASDELDIEYKNISTKLDKLSKEPLLKNWKITGFTADQVILSKRSDMSSTEATSPEFVQYIKERDEAREEARNAKDELTSIQSQLYDALMKIETLEKKSTESAKISTAKKGDPKKKKGAAATHGQNSNVKGSTEVSSASGVSSAKVTDDKCDAYHPPVSVVTSWSSCPEYYMKLAEKLPNLPMSHILDAEKKFIKADTDKSGTIDRKEMDTVMTKTITLFTSAQIDEIFKEVDIDNSNSVDFYECLVILNKLVARRKTNLPQTVQQNYSKTCSIQ